ncbi:MAG: DUF1634 domain-containing protein [Gammaproteobacteria bacterium]|jgi:uncharacterized membrane protein
MQRDLESLEGLIGRLLIIGVVVSGLIALTGGVVYLIHHGNAPVNYHIFRGEPAGLRSIDGVAREVSLLTGRGLIQLGLVSLVALQVMRVALTLWLFHTVRDWKFMAISLVILLALGYSLIGNG